MSTTGCITANDLCRDVPDAAQVLEQFPLREAELLLARMRHAEELCSIQSSFVHPLNFQESLVRALLSARPSVSSSICQCLLWLLQPSNASCRHRLLGPLAHSGTASQAAAFVQGCLVQAGILPSCHELSLKLTVGVV